MATSLKQVGLGASDPTTLGANTANSNLSQTAFSLRCVAVDTGDVNAIRVRCGPSGSGTKTTAIYADNSGQISNATRLTARTSATFTANTLITVTVTPVLAVTVGTNYWIDCVSNGGVWDYTDYDNDPAAGPPGTRRGRRQARTRTPRAPRASRTSSTCGLKGPSPGRSSCPTLTR